MTGQKVGGVFHQELVDGQIVGNQNGQRVFRTPSGPPRLLPDAGDAPRKTNDQGGIEAADVDPKLQGIGAGHTQQFTLEEQLFNIPPFTGQIAPAIGSDHLGQGRAFLSQLFPDITIQQLRMHPGPREPDHLVPSSNQLHHQVFSFGIAASPQARLLDPGRVP